MSLQSLVEIKHSMYLLIAFLLVKAALQNSNWQRSHILLLINIDVIHETFHRDSPIILSLPSCICMQIVNWVFARSSCAPPCPFLYLPVPTGSDSFRARTRLGYLFVFYWLSSSKEIPFLCRKICNMSEVGRCNQKCWLYILF